MKKNEKVSKLIEEYAKKTKEAEGAFNKVKFDTSTKKYIEDSLKEISEFNVFSEEYMHKLPYASQTRSQFSSLVNWVLERSLETDSTVVLKEISHYINKEDYDCFHMGLLSDIFLDSSITLPVDLGNEVFLSTMRCLPESIEKRIPQFALEKGIFSNPVFIYKKIIFTPEFEKTKNAIKDCESIEILKEYYQLIEDAVYCLNLCKVNGLSLQLKETMWATDPEIPMSLWSSYSWKSYRKTEMIVEPLIELELNKAKQLIKNFSSLPNATKEHLRISMNKYGQYSSEIDYVQKAIDLRVAFESFYSLGREGEKTKTLATRAALYSDEDYESRLNISKLIKNFYGQASTAVHTGKIGKKDKKETIEGASQILNKAICKQITNKEESVDWEKLELHGY